VNCPACQVLSAARLAEYTIVIMTATQSAEYLFGDSAVRPVANVYWRRLAFWNIGWNYTSKKHNMHWLAREICNFHTAKSFDAMGISEIFNIEEEHLHEERQVIMQHLVDALNSSAEPPAWTGRCDAHYIFL